MKSVWNTCPCKAIKRCSKNGGGVLSKGHVSPLEGLPLAKARTTRTSKCIVIVKDYWPVSNKSPKPRPT